MFVSRAEAEGTPLSDVLQRYLAEITPTKKATTIARERNGVKVLMDLPLSRRSPLLQTPFPSCPRWFSPSLIRGFGPSLTVTPNG